MITLHKVVNAMAANEAIHRMSGTHVRLRLGRHGMPLIGDLNRSIHKATAQLL